MSTCLYGQVDGEVGDPFSKGIASVDVSTHNFDTINAGDTVYHTFLVKNIGNADLNFKKVECDYGCKVLSFEKGAIAPGKIGKISVLFDSTDRSGIFKKEVAFFCDGRFEFYQYFIKGYIQHSE